MALFKYADVASYAECSLSQYGALYIHSVVLSAILQITDWLNTP
jgi:hypothetical protein